MDVWIVFSHLGRTPMNKSCWLQRNQTNLDRHVYARLLLDALGTQAPATKTALTNHPNLEYGTFRTVRQNRPLLFIVSFLRYSVAVTKI